MTTNTSIDIGSTSQTTIGTITTGTWNASVITVPYGGSGSTSANSYGIICGGTSSTGAYQSVAAGAANTILQANGSSSLPSWIGSLSVSQGGTGKALYLYNNAVLCSGTTSTGALQEVNNIGYSVGYVLTLTSSTGSQLPAWEAANSYIQVGLGIQNDVSGLHLDPSVVTQKAFCIVATTANLSATYVNGTAGVGATLTNNSTQVAISIDGVAPQSGQRVLVKNQTTTNQNGIYTVTTVGSGSTNWVLTRAIDFDGSVTGVIYQGDTVWIQSGTANGITQWMETAGGSFTIGTTPILFTLVSTQSQTLIDQTVPTIGNNPIAVSNGSSTVTLTVSSTSTLHTGDSITVAGATTTGGITAGNLNVTSTITVVTSTTLTYTAGAAATSNATGGGAGVTATYGIAINVYNSYLPDSSSLVTFILPTTSNFGSTFTIIGSGSGGWKISQNSSQNIQFGSSNTTTGTGGSLASSNRYDSITLVCTVASTTWSVTSSIGNITVV